jgi:hypothetical protein
MSCEGVLFLGCALVTQQPLSFAFKALEIFPDKELPHSLSSDNRAPRGCLTFSILNEGDVSENQ